MVLSDVAKAIRRGDTRRCRTQRIELTRKDVSSKLNMMTVMFVPYCDTDALETFILRTSDISFEFSETISAPPASLF